MYSTLKFLIYTFTTLVYSTLPCLLVLTIIYDEFNVFGFIIGVTTVLIWTLVFIKVIIQLNRNIDDIIFNAFIK